MTENERKEKAKNIYTSIEKKLQSLFERWEDEKEYEDFEDYKKIMKDMIESNDGIFIKAFKRPFGFSYKLSDATYQIKMSQTKYSYKRIA